MVVDGEKPLPLHLVEKLGFDAAHFRPRAVDEGVVIEELAADNQRDREYAADEVFVHREMSFSADSHNTFREIVQAEEQCRRWQSRRRKDLKDPLSVGRVWPGARQPHLKHSIANVHHKVRHELNIVVESGRHTAHGLLFVRSRIRLLDEGWLAGSHGRRVNGWQTRSRHILQSRIVRLVPKGGSEPGRLRVGGLLLMVAGRGCLSLLLAEAIHVTMTDLIRTHHACLVSRVRRGWRQELHACAAIDRVGRQILGRRKR